MPFKWRIIDHGKRINMDVQFVRDLLDTATLWSPVNGGKQEIVRQSQLFDLWPRCFVIILADNGLQDAAFIQLPNQADHRSVRHHARSPGVANDAVPQRVVQVPGNALDLFRGCRMSLNAGRCLVFWIELWDRGNAVFQGNKIQPAEDQSDLAVVLNRKSQTTGVASGQRDHLSGVQVVFIPARFNGKAGAKHGNVRDQFNLDAKRG